MLLRIVLCDDNLLLKVVKEETSNKNFSAQFLNLTTTRFLQCLLCLLQIQVTFYYPYLQQYYLQFCYDGILLWLLILLWYTMVFSFV